MWMSVLLFYELTLASLTYFFLPAIGQGEMIEMAVEEGMAVTVECIHNYVQWNVTISGIKFPVALCYDDKCSDNSPHRQELFLAVMYNNYNPPTHRSKLMIKEGWRSISKVYCIDALDKSVLRTWLFTLEVKPTTPVQCETPILTATQQEMFYILTITCSIELYQKAIFSLELKSPIDIYYNQTTYSYAQSVWSRLYNTTYEHRMCVYVKQRWDTSRDVFRVVAYPDVSQGRDHTTVTTPWMPLFPKVEGLITNFTLNSQSSDVTVSCNETVAVECEGQGEMGSPLELFDTVPSKELATTRVPMVIRYSFSASDCGLQYTFGCRVGSDERYRHLTIKPRADYGSDKTKYILAASISLTVGTLVTVVIIFFCVRMRLRQKSTAMPGRRPPPAYDLPPAGGRPRTFAQPPPAYDDIYFTGASGDRRELLDCSLSPPPYTAQPGYIPDDGVSREAGNEYVTCGVYGPINTEVDTQT